jgi:hypothetical protein
MHLFFFPENSSEIAARSCRAGRRISAGKGAVKDAGNAAKDRDCLNSYSGNRKQICELFVVTGRSTEMAASVTPATTVYIRSRERAWNYFTKKIGAR